jgi:hypothetical protein
MAKFFFIRVGEASTMVELAAHRLSGFSGNDVGFLFFWEM